MRGHEISKSCTDFVLILSRPKSRRITLAEPYHITNVNDDGTIPAAPPPNWLSYNNFRSGDLSEPGEFADAISIDVDTTDVDELRLEAVPNEAECIVDPANEIVLEAPFCKIPG